MRQTDFFAACVTGCARRRSIVSERPNGGFFFGAVLAVPGAQLFAQVFAGAVRDRRRGPVARRERYRLRMRRIGILSSLACSSAIALAGGHAARASDIDALRALAGSSGADAWPSPDIAWLPRHDDPSREDLDSLPHEWCAFSFDPSVIHAGALDESGPAREGSTAARRFGAAGSWRWQILGGGGTGTDSISNAQLGAGVSWFVVDDLSIDVQANADYFNQSGPSAWGGDVELLFRWHFLARDTWSLYVDGGCGLMWTSQDVPPDSASFNFIPQAGAGLTWEIASDTRLMLGARWFHASNANTGSPNPSYNGVFVYAGVSFGF